MSLFTENYMVRFLLENSLGAWWAARHPESALVAEFEYLRFGEGGGAFPFSLSPDYAARCSFLSNTVSYSWGLR
jgi:hypothetical protein